MIADSDEMLRVGSLNCPDDDAVLHFHVFGGMRIRSKNDAGNDKYDAKCPTCNKYWHVKAPKEKL